MVNIWCIICMPVHWPHIYWTPTNASHSPRGWDIAVNKTDKAHFLAELIL